MTPINTIITYKVPKIKQILQFNKIFVIIPKFLRQVIKHMQNDWF